MSEDRLFGHGGRLYAAEEPEPSYEPPQERVQRKEGVQHKVAAPRPVVAQVKQQPVPRVKRDLREPVSTAAELAGITALTVGFFLLAPWAGLIALGLCLVILGVAMSPRWDRE